MRACFENFLRDFRLLRATELLFFLLSFTMGISYALFDTDFAKTGVSVPLPSGVGGLPGQEPKIFMMELFLIVASVIFLVHAWRYRSFRALAWRDPLWFCVVAVFVLGIIRISYDLPANPILVARNSCFVWYLFLPLAAFHSGISVATFRCIGLAIIMSIAAFFLAGVLIDFAWFGRTTVRWLLPGGGIIGLILIFLYSPSWKLFWALLPIMSLAFGSLLYTPVNRTTLLAQLAAIALVFIIASHRRKRAQRLLVRFIIVLLISTCASFLWGARLKQLHPVPRWPFPEKPISIEQQVFHSEATDGVEFYRWEMWKDAWLLFRNSPWLGVGFERQVVFRLYEGFGKFVNNDVAQMKGPPVSGPHNSYLNALARMGIFGSIFLAIHALMLATLFQAKEKVVFWLVWAQVFYAFFNVALEGPTRSFCLLLFLGMALGLRWENSVGVKSSSKSGEPDRDALKKIVPTFPSAHSDSVQPSAMLDSGPV